MTDRLGGSARTISDTLRAATQALAKRPETTPGLEAELLLTQATGWSRTRLMAWPEHPLGTAEAAAFDALLARRLGGEPIAYIRGRQSFWTLDLAVSPATLIPRPETERLVELALARLPASRRLVIADLGTGSGAIAAALASECPNWYLIATDRSAAALSIAAGNFRALGLTRIMPLQGHWLAPLADRGLDAIVTNPPYIASNDPHLGRGDLRFEPTSALASGDDGLAAIRVIARDARRCLRPGGLLLVEHGFEQGTAVRALLADQGLRAIETHQDLANLDRVTLGVAD